MPGSPSLNSDILVRTTAVQTATTKPAADSAANATMADVVGNKSDAAAANNTAAGTESLVAMLKRIMTHISATAADSTSTSAFKDVIGNKSDAAQTTVGTTRSIMAYVKGILTTVLTIATDVATIKGSAWVSSSAEDSSTGTVDSGYTTLANISGRGHVDFLKLILGAGTQHHIRITVDGTVRYSRVHGAATLYLRGQSEHTAEQGAQALHGWTTADTGCRIDFASAFTIEAKSVSGASSLGYEVCAQRLT